MTERDWAYELWVHLSDHVVQHYELDEPDDCEHCRKAEVDCDDCRRLIIDWPASLDPESVPIQGPTHPSMRAALEQIVRRVHPAGRASTCAGFPSCLGCIASYTLWRRT